LNLCSFCPHDTSGENSESLAATLDSNRCFHVEFQFIGMGDLAMRLGGRDHFKDWGSRRSN
jgi:hypothetical protein